MDIGIVSGEIGILPEYRGVTGTPPGVNGPTWALREKRRAGQEEGAPGGILLPPGVGSPPFLVGIGFGKGEEEREKEGGRRPPLLVLFGLRGRGARPSPGHLSSLPLRLIMAH